MAKYIGKRLLALIPTILGVLILVFIILEATPGDPGRIILGASAPQESVDQLNHELGADRPFLERMADYFVGLFRGDFGESYRTGENVMTEILARFPTTLKLAALAALFSSLLGISLGIFSAVKQYSLWDNFLTVWALLFACIPAFWLGFMLMYVFGVELSWLPTSGASTWQHFVLPVTVLTLSGSAGIMRITRTAMLDTIRQDYIRTARAKGAKESAVLWRHALKNALMPVITVIGTDFGALLGGAIILESVFAMPGVGSYLINAIQAKDAPVVLTTTLFLSVVFCLVVLAVDLIYAAIDPRVRKKYTEG